MSEPAPDPFFFGYGSLVNRNTHDYPKVQKARVSGWRRLWRHTTFRNVAYLTVVPDNGCEIDGLIAAVPNADWAALDLRETNYQRVDLPKSQISHGVLYETDVKMYKLYKTHDAPPSDRHPILLSYLDCVIKGFLDEFGEQGVADFVATTDGWDSPVLNDRAAPIYPRHVKLSVAETAMVDDLPDKLPAQVKQLRQPRTLDKPLWGA